jgi:subtilase family serine protease
VASLTHSPANPTTADTTSVVAESNESNNITTDIYTVTTAPLPDLIISEFWTATPYPPWPKPSGKSTFVRPVINIGAALAGATGRQLG